MLWPPTVEADLNPPTRPSGGSSTGTAPLVSEAVATGAKTICLTEIGEADSDGTEALSEPGVLLLPLKLSLGLGVGGLDTSPPLQLGLSLIHI